MDPIGIYNQARRKFVMIVYCLVFLMILVALGQWMIILNVESGKELFKKYTLISMLSYAVGNLFLLFFIFNEKIRFVQCLNGCFALVIMELDTIGVMCNIVKLKTLHFVYAFFAVFIICFLVILLGSMCAMDITVAVIQLFVLTVMSFMSSIYYVLTYKLVGHNTCFYIFLCHAVWLILCLMIYQVQTIHGSHYAEMRVKDYYLAALILFTDFIMLLLISIYVEMKVTNAIEEAIKKAALKVTTAAPAA